MSQPLFHPSQCLLPMMLTDTYADLLAQPPVLHICLDADALAQLRVQPTETSQLLLPADELLALVDTTEPSIGDRPALRDYLSTRTGKLVGLVPDGFEYLFRFIPE